MRGFARDCAQERQPSRPRRTHDSVEDGCTGVTELAHSRIQMMQSVQVAGRTEREQPGRTKELASTSSVDGSGCASTGAGGPWATGDIGARTGTFVVEADVSVSASGSDALFGLSNGVARTYADLAAIVRFNSSGVIDARNGGSYQADDRVPYTPGTPY